MQILLVNSNSTIAVTDRMVEAANTVASPHTTVTGMTASGAAVIRSHFEFAEAAVQTVLALQQNAAGHDAAIIGCFGDPGLKAARQELDIPVVGLAEAAMLMAHPLGGRYSVITFGQHHRINIADLARSYGLHSRLASVRIAQVSYSAILEDPGQALDACVEAGKQALSQDGADVLILGGGPVAGMASKVSVMLDVPVLDSLACATKLAESLAACGYKTSRFGLYQSVL
ncbi:MAG: aspartate/glutamate racemase family protein [Thainema sp.]